MNFCFNFKIITFLFQHNSVTIIILALLGLMVIKKLSNKRNPLYDLNKAFVVVEEVIRCIG